MCHILTTLRLINPQVINVLYFLTTLRLINPRAINIQFFKYKTNKHASHKCAIFRLIHLD